MLSKGIKDVVMEVSSHSLALERVADLRFTSAIFTNLTQDHLDFHHDMDEYFQVKKKLFDMTCGDQGAGAIVNVDDEYGHKLVQEFGGGVVTYAIDRKADYKAEINDISMTGSVFDLHTSSGSKKVKVKLIGKFNVYNCLAAIAWGIEKGGMDMETVCNVVSQSLPVPGRLEIAGNIEKQEKFVVIDYAHTPAALENVLMTLRTMTNGIYIEPIFI